MNRILAIFYDLDNTLYPQFIDVKQRFEACLEKIPLQRSVGEEFLCSEWLDNGPRKTDIFDQFIEKFNPPCTKEELIGIYRSCRTNLKLPDENRLFLVRMRKRGILQFLITNGRVETQMQKIDVLGLRRLFDDVIIASGDYAKPSPACFTSCMNRYYLNPTECISVGDWYEIDGLAAKKCGIPFYYMEGGPIQEDVPDGIPRIRSIPELYEVID